MRVWNIGYLIRYSTLLTGAGAGMGMAETATAKREVRMYDFILSAVDGWGMVKVHAG